MGEKTGISWTHSTFNPWIGCTRVSPGCENCYAEAQMDKRWGRVKWGPGSPRVRTSPTNWRGPIRWNSQASPEAGVRQRVFCASLADWLDHDGIPWEWLADLLDLIAKCENLDWLMLTKRPHLWASRIAGVYDWAGHNAGGRARPGIALARRWLDGQAPGHVWLGTTVEDQRRAEERIPVLMGIPAALRFLSVEPLLGPLKLPLLEPDTVDPVTGTIEGPGPRPDWVIVGGESGAQHRPMDLTWARDVVTACQAAEVPVFVKQLGGYPDPRHDIAGFPADLQVQQVPCSPVGR